MQTVKNILQKWNSISLVKRIICGLIVGIILGLVVPQATGISILGDLFVGALRGIAPVLVFFLVMSALCHMGKGQKTNMKMIVILYMAGNVLAAACAVIASYIFPIVLTFTDNTDTSDVAPPSGVTEVLTNLLMNLVDNPVNAIVNANYIGILAWAIIFGIALKGASEGTKNALENISDAVSIAVQWVISCAPFGIMGLIFTTISEQGLSVLLGYGRLILVLVGTMAVRTSDPGTGWNHGCGCPHCQPHHRIPVYPQEPIQADLHLSEGKLYHRVLHQKFRGQYPGKYETV